MSPLSGRQALVVGASRGIGAAVARRLAADGATMTLVARDADLLRGVVRQCAGAGHETFSGDVTDDAVRDALLARLAERGTPDIVVSGLRVREPWTPIRRTRAVDFAESVRCNTEYLIALMAALLPAQRARGFGRWVAISSIAAQLGGAGQAAYIAQKAALEGVIRTLAIEEGNRGITANVVSPGFIATEGTAANYPADTFAALSVMNATGRCGTPAEVAHVVAMLVHPDGGFVTGANVPVSGGSELGWPSRGVGVDATEVTRLFGTRPAS